METTHPVIDNQMKSGFSFGMVSGTITTLGLMVGLHSGTHSRLAVIGGILTIAIADAFSDALGMHVSQESEVQHTTKEIWRATLYTFFSKFIFALTFLIPILLFELSDAIIISVIWGILLLGVFSYVVAKQEREKPWKVISEHVGIGLLVIIITHYAGDWISATFG